MTTPQSELWNISRKIQCLMDLFDKYDKDYDEDSDGERRSLFEDVKRLYNGHENVLKRLDKLEDQLALIIKLLRRSSNDCEH